MAVSCSCFRLIKKYISVFLKNISYQNIQAQCFALSLRVPSGGLTTFHWCVRVPVQWERPVLQLSGLIKKAGILGRWLACLPPGSSWHCRSCLLLVCSTPTELPAAQARQEYSGLPNVAQSKNWNLSIISWCALHVQKIILLTFLLFMLIHWVVDC